MSAEDYMQMLNEVGGERFSAQWQQSPVAEGTEHVDVTLCRLLTNARGDSKFAQEAERLPVPIDEVIRYGAFGLVRNWVLWSHHPSPKPEIERARNRAELKLMRARGQADGMSQAQLDEMSWTLL